jgi:hypothetical protein
MYDGTLYTCTDNTTGAAVWEIYISNVPNLTQVLNRGDRAYVACNGDYQFVGSDIATFLINDANTGTPIFTIDGDNDNDFLDNCVLKFQSYLQPSQLVAINGAQIYVKGEPGYVTTYDFNVGDLCELKKLTDNAWFLNVSNAGTSSSTPTLQQVLDNNHDLVGDNFFAGNSAGFDNLGINVNAFGNSSAANNSGSDINALGDQAGVTNTGNNVNAFGNSCLSANIGNDVNAFGNNAANVNYGSKVNAFGNGSANVNLGNDVNAFGNSSGINNQGSDVNLLGSLAGQANSGNNVNAFGANAGGTNTGNNVNVLGNNASDRNTGNDVNALGNNAGALNTFSNVNLFGDSASADEDGQTVLSKDGTIMARISTTELTASRKYTLQDADGTLAFIDDIPTTTSQLTNDGADGVNPFITALDIPTTGQASTLVREVKNMTGATLTKGTVVFISGANGNKALVSKAIATTDALSARTFGLLQSNILNNGTGNCVIIGDLSGLDTSSFAEGAQLYLSGVTAGTYTDTRTLAPTHLVYVGKVTRSHPTQGQIEVQIQNGYELEEIHDCQIISPTNNQALIYETSTDLWKNKTIIEDSITNAVTDKAPSQNAVFDALALKQDTLTYTPVKTVVKDTAVSSTVTGTTTETILKSYTIAGGTFAANDVINLISARFTKSGNVANISTFKMYINTSNSLSGAVQIAQLQGTGAYYKFSRTFALRGGSLFGFSFTANGIQAGLDQGNTSVSQSSTTLNPANTFYIILTGANAISTDSILCSEILITN